jgi:hypothetical protein
MLREQGNQFVGQAALATKPRDNRVGYWINHCLQKLLTDGVVAVLFHFSG